MAESATPKTGPPQALQLEFPGISRNFPEFPGISGISRNFLEFPGNSRRIPVAMLEAGLFLEWLIQPLQKQNHQNHKVGLDMAQALCLCSNFPLLFQWIRLKTLISLLFFAVLMVLFLEWLNQPLQKQTRLKYCNCAQSWPGHGSSIAPVQQFSFIVLMDSIENVNFLSFLWF